MEKIRSKFEKIGARVRAHTSPVMFDPVRVDIRTDGQGEYFELEHADDVHVRVLDSRPTRDMVLRGWISGTGAGRRNLGP